MNTMIINESYSLYDRHLLALWFVYCWPLAAQLVMEGRMEQESFRLIAENNTTYCYADDDDNDEQDYDEEEG